MIGISGAVLVAPLALPVTEPTRRRCPDLSAVTRGVAPSATDAEAILALMCRTYDLKDFIRFVDMNQEYQELETDQYRKPTSSTPFSYTREAFYVQKDRCNETCSITQTSFTYKLATIPNRRPQFEANGPYAPFGFESIKKQLWRNKQNDRPISDSEIKAVLSQLFKTGQWLPPAGHVSEDVTSHA
ncbi:hypothetical protein AVEN_129127-1 [Araneus ventricosus]|uniref:Uncharacterized protein n=1 Tax=Araneus ventricosus TaxID=182803 RepID=A0A4Y2S036_ARAVE|nr:hypothetical protein AVEN_129127-1 [Araneus ventricosus]